MPVAAIGSSVLGGSALGGLAAGGLGLLGGILTNQTNTANAQAQMAFQAQQSATAYQRATSDMKAAGLNPMLAYTQGGASTSPGALARVENPVPAAVQAYTSTAATNASVRQANAQADLTSAQAASTAIDVRNKAAALDQGSESNARGAVDLTTVNQALGILKANNDYNTITNLNNIAGKMGYGSTFDAAKQSADFRSQVIDNTLKSNLIPQSTKDAAFSSGVGGTVAPWAKLLAPLTNSASTFKNAFSPLKPK